MKPGDRVVEIERRLRAKLAPEFLHVEDEGHLHAGHAGARSGRGHFRISIVAAAFEGQTMLARHRMIYAAIGELMQTDIHALAIEATASSEL